MNLVSRFAWLELLLLLSAAGCATAIHGRKQEVDFSSDPSGATVLVDGVNVGTTPTSAMLVRRDSHSVRIEKQGYVPYEASLGSTSEDRWNAEVAPAAIFPPLLVLPVADYWLGGTSQIVPGKVSAHLLSAPANAIPANATAQPSSANVASTSDANQASSSTKDSGAATAKPQ